MREIEKSISNDWPMGNEMNILELMNQILGLLRKAGVEARVSEMWGEKDHPYLVISLINVRLVDDEPVIEEG